jgi:hypothetical protein
VRRWLKRADWPLSRLPPWPVEVVGQWAANKVRRDPAAAYRQRVAATEAATGEPGELSPGSKARQAWFGIRARRELHKLRLDEGKVHDAVECRVKRLRQLHDLTGRLSELPRSLMGILAMQPAEQIEQLLAEAIGAIADDYGKDPENAPATQS